MSCPYHFFFFLFNNRIYFTSDVAIFYCIAKREYRVKVLEWWVFFHYFIRLFYSWMYFKARNYTLPCRSTFIVFTPPWMTLSNFPHGSIFILFKVLSLWHILGRIYKISALLWFFPDCKESQFAFLYSEFFTFCKFWDAHGSILWGKATALPFR